MKNLTGYFYLLWLAVFITGNADAKTASPNGHGEGLISVSPQNWHQPPEPFPTTEPSELAPNVIEAASTALPPAVDNSALPAFPPIGDQGGQGSCVAWATTYYQMSYETCHARKCQNGEGSPTIFSPSWTYNMINGGEDYGSSFESAFTLLTRNGASSLNQFPYQMWNFLLWDLNPLDWRTAIGFRMEPVKFISGIATPAGLAKAKRQLANGHVLTFGTYIDSFEYGVISNAPSQTSPYAGQTIVEAMNGTTGSHAMTLVGYNDSVWVDLNHNGVVDPGELGAFKVANSWGTSWGNAGFVWISYDALKGQSGVTGVQNATNRLPLMQDNSVFALFAQKTYSPKLLASFTLNSIQRNQVSVSVGSSASGTQPTKKWTSGALNYSGGPYMFDGTYGGNGSVEPIDASFVLDLTDVMGSKPSTLSYYLILSSDLGAGRNPLTLKAFEVDWGQGPHAGDLNVSFPGTLPLFANPPGATAIIPNVPSH